MKLSINELYYFIDYIKKDCGITLPQTNYSNLEEFITERINHYNINSFEYLALLDNDKSEKELFYDIVTINETYFFREEKHFIVLKNSIFPKIKSNFVTFWSVTCSTGEEAISLAIFAEEYLYNEKNIDYIVYATDIDSFAINKLKKGEYGPNSFRTDGKIFHYLIDKYFDKKNDMWILKQNIKNKIYPYKANLFTDNLENINNFVDIAFFRNTLIYMDYDTRKFLVDKVMKKIKNDGYLFTSINEVSSLDFLSQNLIFTDNIYYIQKKEVNLNNNETTENILIKNSINNTEKKLDQNNNYYEKYNDDNIKNQLINLNDFKELLENYFDNEEKVENIQLKQIIKIIKQIFYYMDKQVFKLAIEETNKLKNLISNEDIICYLTALINYRNNNYKESINLFNKSININKDMWISHYYLGQLYLSNSSEIDKAKKEFNNCKNILENKKHNSYKFLLDGFDEKYFNNICNKLLLKYQNK